MKRRINFESLYKKLFDGDYDKKKDTLGLKRTVSDNVPVTMMGIGLIILIISDVTGMDHDLAEGLLFVFFVLPALFIALLISLYNQYNDRKAYKKLYIKNTLFPPLIHNIDPSFKYDAINYIPRTLFVDSKIFDQRIGSYKGNDLVMGRIDETYIMFSDLLVQNFFQTIFQGQFIVAEFNKNFEGTTVVSTDYAEALFGNVIGGLIQSRGSDNTLIKMDHPGFEEVFAVHGSDKVEAHYILTPSLMEYILNYQKKTGRYTEISFVNNAICIALPYDRDQFEAEDKIIFGLESELESVINEEYVKPLEFASGIIRELKLNEKLWSRE